MLLALLAASFALRAHAGLILEPYPGVDEPRFYERLGKMVADLETSGDPILRRLVEAAKASPAKIRIRPITDDRSTWNSDGTRTRGHTDPDDKRSKASGRTSPADATVYVPPEAVEPGERFWKSGTLVHELTHAIDLANGRYSPTTSIRERRATFMQNVWRARTGYTLRTSYHERFPTLDYQEAARRGSMDEYARYIFTRPDFPAPAAARAPAGEKDED